MGAVVNSYKLFGILLVFVLLVGVGCQSSVDTSSSEQVFTSSEQVLGFVAVSAVEELQQDVVVSEGNSADFNPETVDAKSYIANTFLGDSAEFSVDVENSSVYGYDKTMTIRYVDMNENVNTHEFHYNETIREVEDDETESVISGIIFVNGVEYTLMGTKEEENGEYEYDLVAFIDDENYLTITYEVEQESATDIEKEFVYERFVDNQLVYRMEVEFEVEDGEKEITIKLLDGAFESEYSFTSELEDGREEIKVEYKTSENGVVLEEGEYTE